MPSQSFFYGNPDLYAQQLMLQRQQGLADSLSQQAQQPATPDNWNSMPVVPRLGAGGALAKMGQMLGSAYMQKEMVGKTADLQAKQIQYATQLMQDPANNPNGIAPATAARMAIQNPDQWNALNQRVQTPTDSVLNSIQTGGTAEQRHAAEVARLTAAAQVPTPQGYHTDATNPGGPSVYTAAPPANTNPTVAPNGMVSSVTPIPGALPATAQNAQATAYGSSQGSPVNLPPGPGGEQRVAMPATPDFLRSPTVQPQGPMTPNPAPSSAGLGGRTIVSGPSTTTAGLQGSAREWYSADTAPANVQGLKQANSGLENALNILAQHPVGGSGSSTKYTWLAYAQNAGIPILEGDTTGYQSVNKYLHNSLMQSGGATAGSDARLSSLAEGNPNLEHMGPKALIPAIRYVLSQNDASLARSSYVTQRAAKLSAAGDSNAVQHSYDSWNSSMDPRYFEARRQETATAPPTQAGAYFKAPNGNVYRELGGGKSVQVTAPDPNAS
jgi:hypothetical protein